MNYSFNIFFLIGIIIFGSMGKPVNAATYNLSVNSQNWPRGYYCYIYVYANGKLISKQNTGDGKFSVEINDDVIDNIAISWRGEKIGDGPLYRGSCEERGAVSTAELYANEWRHIESTWPSYLVRCLQLGLAHNVGIKYHTQVGSDPSTKYISPTHPYFTNINNICGDVFMRTKLKNNYGCTPIDVQEWTLCDDKFTLNNNGVYSPLSLDGAVFAKIDKLDVSVQPWETADGKTRRLERQAELQDRRVADAKRQAWLKTPEGKKYLADEAAKQARIEAAARREREQCLAANGYYRTTNAAAKNLIARKC